MTLSVTSPDKGDQHACLERGQSRGEQKKCGGNRKDAKAHEYQHTNRRVHTHPARSAASQLLSLPVALKSY